MLRQAQHERKISNDFISCPVRPFDELRAGSESFDKPAVRPELVEGNGWFAQDRLVEG